VHLAHLALRVEQKLLDDTQYDKGNLCLLKLLGFTPGELSNLGNAAPPAQNDAAALKKYQDQLDERSYKLNAASVHLTREIQKAWNPNAVRGEAATLRISADQQYLKVVVVDDLGVEVELDQRSEGLNWLVSFFVVFFAEAEDGHARAILLLDEPGLTLHGLKQREFRSTLSRLAEDNQLLFTTHSPFLVGPDELPAVRVVDMPNREVGTKVHTILASTSPEALLPLQEALGYDLAQSLFAQQRNLVVEGLTDFWYLEATSRLLQEAGQPFIHDKIALIPANSAGKVVYFATILHAHQLKVAALLDSDAAGDQAASQETLVHSLGHKRILRTKDTYEGDVSRPEIEDLLRATLVQVGKESLGWDVEAEASAQVSRPLLEVFEHVVGKGFSKYKLAKAYVKWTRENTAAALSNVELEAWKRLVLRVNDALK
jgi:hypothetical protein